MDAPKNDVPKLPDMVMCGDHPSLTKTELNAKEQKPEEKEKPKERVKTPKPMSYARITPSSSRSERICVSRSGGGGAVVVANAVRTATSEATLRMLEARRRVRSLEVVHRAEAEAAPGNRALVQAALGSFRWPPYLLCVWVAVLVLTHVLHCLVTVLERVLPNVKKICQYFRVWTEDAWKLENDLNHRMIPMALALVTGLLYIFYFGVYVLYSMALWSIEPLCTELEDNKSCIDVDEKITNYEESKSNSSVKR